MSENTTRVRKALCLMLVAPSLAQSCFMRAASMNSVCSHKPLACVNACPAVAGNTCIYSLVLKRLLWPLEHLAVNGAPLQHAHACIPRYSRHDEGSSAHHNQQCQALCSHGECLVAKLLRHDSLRSSFVMIVGIVGVSGSQIHSPLRHLSCLHSEIFTSVEGRSSHHSQQCQALCSHGECVSLQSCYVMIVGIVGVSGSKMLCLAGIPVFAEGQCGLADDHDSPGVPWKALQSISSEKLRHMAGNMMHLAVVGSLFGACIITIAKRQSPDFCCCECHVTS